MNPSRSSVGLLLVLLFSAATMWAEETQVVRQFEHVLGTSLELRMSVSSAEIADDVEHAALAEIERLAKLLSRHDPDSELMRWQNSSQPTAKLSPELSHVLQRAEHWRQQTAGAFDIRAAAVMKLWEQAERRQQAVSAEDRRAVVAQLTVAPYEFLAATEIQRHDDLPITLDALGKGYILDAVCERIAEKFPAVKDFSVMIGGDLRKLGNQPRSFAITDPTNPAEGAATLGTIKMQQPFALATSGNYRRFYQIGGRRFSHIVDPRTGLTAGEVLSATVIAPRGIDADALATSLSVLAPQEGLELIEALPDTSCLLVLANGEQIASRNWPPLEESRPVAFVAKFAEGEEKKEEEAKTGLLVNFTLNRARGGRAYRRPYVAVWLENEDGYPVKTALLWLLKDQPGPKWHRDLTRWYRNDRTRKAEEKTDLIATISGATRGPGEYETRFDGTDNAGKPLPDGKYFLCLESNREHGSYNLIRTEVELKGEAIARQELKESSEMSKVSFEYIPPTSGPAAEDK